MISAPFQFLRTLRILHLALTSGVLVFGIIVFILKQEGLVQPVLQAQEPALLPVAGALIIAGIGVSTLLFRRRLEALRSMATLDRKLASYRSAQVTRWALAEFPALLVVVLIMLTSSPLFLVFAAAALTYLAGSRPPTTIDQACATMNISPDDRARWEQEL